jgi:uncharacterized protein
MPPPLTYPGVYVVEKPSGVRTITGVSTSVTAFLGSAKQGPVEEPVHVLNWSTFVKTFGGLDPGSEMSYAVQQFFANGGSDAWVVRLAANPAAATVTLKDPGADDVLSLTALDQGDSGNFIGVTVDYNTPTPASTFNLTIAYQPADPSAAVTETFTSLSMNSADPRYVVDIVNGSSQLVQAARVASAGVLSAISGVLGFAVSGALTDPLTAGTLDDRHNSFRVAVNGLPPVTVTLNPVTFGTASLTALGLEIANQVSTKGAPFPAYVSYKCIKDPGSTPALRMKSGVGGEVSTVRVLPGATNDASQRLKLGPVNGGSITDATTSLRPAQVPVRGALTGSAAVAGFPLTVASPNTTLGISVNGLGPDTIDLTGTYAGGPAVAAAIQAAVRAKRPIATSYAGFTADGTGDILTLTSGAGGNGSGVLVSAGTLATTLKLGAGATATAPPRDVTLAGGNADLITDANAYTAYTGDPSARTGLYAFDEVDIFNLMCLPGVSDFGILSDAVNYCQSRRAFLIVDAPDPRKSVAKPDAMAAYILGPNLPKSSYAAVYYPWVMLPDALNNGKLRLTAPSGVVAGIFARTDANRGVWKAPAGTEAVMNNVQGVAYKLTDAENGTLNPHAVNCARLFPVYNTVVWGARTLEGDDQAASEYKYVPVRRLALFLEESLFRATKWVVFEPNDEPLWAQIRLNIGAFLHNLFRQGAFQGSSPSKAYFVKCDGETTTQNDIDLGVVNIVVGFAPLKPAEFVVITIQQIAGDLQT